LATEKITIIAEAPTAEHTGYDNTARALTVEAVQAALGELVSRVDALEAL
jgi:hypothetical protein